MVNVSMLSRYEQSAHFTNLKKARKIDPQFSGQQLDSMVITFPKPESEYAIHTMCTFRQSLTVLYMTETQCSNWIGRIYIPCWVIGAAAAMNLHQKSRRPHIEAWGLICIGPQTIRYLGTHYIAPSLYGESDRDLTKPLCKVRCMPPPSKCGQWLRINLHRLTCSPRSNGISSLFYLNAHILLRVTTSDLVKILY